MIRSDKNTLILVVTRRCNLRCPHCKVVKSNNDMDFETAWKAVSLFLGENGFSQRPLIRFFGGESLLNFNVVKQIVNRAGKKFANVDFDLSTNGLLLDGEKARFFRRNPNLKLIVSSVRPKIFRSRLFQDGFARLPSLVVTINLLPGKMNLARETFIELMRRGINKFKFLPAYYVKWTPKEIKSLQKNFKIIEKAIKDERIKIRLENLEHKNEVPLFSSAPAVDCGGDVYFGNYFLDKDIDKYGDMLKLGNVRNLSDWRAVSNFPLSVDPNYILAKTFSREVLKTTMEADRILTKFLGRVSKYEKS